MAEHIQINDVTPRIIYTANGTQTAFTYPFAIFKAADLEVYLNGVKQVSGFTVAGAGSSTGGTATFAAAPAAAVQVTLRRQLAVARTSDYQTDGIIRAKTLNDELDYQVAAIQQVAEDASRAIKRSATSANTAALTLPEPVAGKAIGWNADATGLTNDPADFAGTVATVTAQAGIAAAAATTAGGHAGTAGTQAGIATTAAGNAAASAAAALASENAAQDYAAAADVAKIEWQGAWNSGAAYALRDAVSYGGGSWICVQAHTNQPPADNAYWDVVAAKGTDGAGAGDVLAENNLSDLTDPSAALSNLGLTPAGQAVVTAANPAAQRAALGLGTAALVDILDEDSMASDSPSRPPSQQSVKAYIAANVVPAAILARLDFLELNLAINTLRDQIDTGWTVLKMVDGVADEFEDSLGIDIAASVGAQYDPDIRAYSNAGLSSVATAGAVAFYGAVNPGYTMVDRSQALIASGKIISVKVNSSNSSAGCKLKILNEDSATQYDVVWDQAFNHPGGGDYTVTLGVPFAVPASGTYRIGVYTGSSGLSHWSGIARAYKAVDVTGVNQSGFTDVVGPNIFVTANYKAVTDCILTSVASSAAAEPSEVRLVALHQPAVVAIPNVDYAAEATRDGTTWSAGSLSNEGDFDATTNILSAVIDLSGQPGGTSLQWRFKMLSQKEQRLHGVWMQWR